MPWYNTFDAVFWTGFSTMTFGFLAVLLRYGFMSKCDNVNLCCGLLTIHRAVELEQPNVEDGKQQDALEEEKHGV